MNISLSWSDQFFLLTLTLLAIGLLVGLRKSHQRRAIMYLLHQPVAVCSGIVLSFFLGVAVLDSIHFSAVQTTDQQSVLDRLISPLGESMESSYSAPMALTLYTHWADKSHLSYPSTQIKTPSDRYQFVSKVLIRNSLWCSGIGLLLLLSSRRWWKQLPLRLILSVGITLLLCCWIVAVCYGLSREFHVLGTGKIGQDILYYAIKSIRTGMIIGLLTLLFALPFALFLGIAAGYYGGRVDDIIQFIYTTISSIPGVLLITASVLSLQTYISNHPLQFNSLIKAADARLVALCFILGMTSWTTLCRLLRAEALKLREIDYVLAARALGSHSLRIIGKHMLPNVMHIVIITLTLDFSFLVLAEAVLSYVGVGVSPMTISWGNMINAARLELARDPVVWWPVFAAFIFMFSLVLASNLFADEVREAFDPHEH